MARRNRCDFPGAIHLVSLNGYSGGQVFYDSRIFVQFPDNPRAHAPDSECFESLLWETCEQYEGRVHGFILEPNAALIVLQTLGARLSWIVHDILARYSMLLSARNRMPKGQRPFPRRYKAQIVQPTKLPYVVRHIQRREIAALRYRRPINHPFSSSLIYCGRRPRPKCFVVIAMQEALTHLGHVGPNAYFEFMSAGDSPYITHMLSRNVIGDRSFAESLRDGYPRMRRTPSPDEILREVTGTILHTDPEIACTSTHLGAIARALVAWYAMRTGSAQIGAVARWFDVTSSDLRHLIRIHQRKTPEYFSKSSADLFPELAGETAVPGPAERATSGARAAGMSAPMSP